MLRLQTRVTVTEKASLACHWNHPNGDPCSIPFPAIKPTATSDLVKGASQNEPSDVALPCQENDCSGACDIHLALSTGLRAYFPATGTLDQLFNLWERIGEPCGEPEEERDDGWCWDAFA
jgi:hypothetical protein